MNNSWNICYYLVILSLMMSIGSRLSSMSFWSLRLNGFEPRLRLRLRLRLGVFEPMDIINYHSFGTHLMESRRDVLLGMYAWIRLKIKVQKVGVVFLEKRVIVNIIWKIIVIKISFSVRVFVNSKKILKKIAKKCLIISVQD